MKTKPKAQACKSKAKNTAPKSASQPLAELLNQISLHIEPSATPMNSPKIAKPAATFQPKGSFSKGLTDALASLKKA